MDSHGGWCTLAQEMRLLTQELKFKRRDHGAIAILGDLSAVASDWVHSDVSEKINGFNPADALCVTCSDSSFTPTLALNHF